MKRECEMLLDNMEVRDKNVGQEEARFFVDVSIKVSDIVWIEIRLDKRDDVLADSPYLGICSYHGGGLCELKSFRDVAMALNLEGVVPLEVFAAVLVGPVFQLMTNDSQHDMILWQKLYGELEAAMQPFLLVGAGHSRGVKWVQRNQHKTPAWLQTSDAFVSYRAISEMLTWVIFE
jgi:hypothetical protein